MATYQGHNEDSSGNLLLNIGNGMTATVELTNKASQAYTKGAYLFFNNRFCKASSAIAANATLAIGTNLTETSIGAELTSHLRSSDGKEFYFDVKNGQYGYYPSASKTASEFVPFGGTTAVTGTKTTTSGQATSVTVGFKPSYLVITAYNANDIADIYSVAVYNKDVSTSQYVGASHNSNSTVRNLNSGSLYGIKSIDSNGFTAENCVGFPFRYIAVP